MATNQTQLEFTFEPVPGWRTLSIRAGFTEGIDPELIYWEDWDVPGRYEVMVPADMDDATAAACALGGFHSTVPIKRLYTFEFRIFDGSENNELEPDRDQDWYELAKKCGDVHCRSKDRQDECP
jgi:hypothetical protein